jgi:hypothetical protein
MTGSAQMTDKFFRFCTALALIASMVFSAPLWSADKPETEEDSVQETPTNQAQSNQPAEEAEIPSDFKADDFKPSEEISEDFPVPLPSDI